MNKRLCENCFSVATKRSHRTVSMGLSIITLLTAIVLAGCATTEQTNQLQRSIVSNQSEVLQLRQDMEARLSKLERDQEALGKQIVTMYSSIETRDEKLKGMAGRIDELDYQLRTYWTETKNLLAIVKSKPGINGTTTAGSKSSQGGIQTVREPDAKEPDATSTQDDKYEEAYKQAFESFQKGNLEEAAQRFSAFIDKYSGTPLAANAYYWIGESYMGLKNYDKAIVFFQEIMDKYPKNEKAPRAMLSQAEAFRLTNDKKSSITILKRVIELYPKTEEAVMAERKLRSGNL